MSNPRPASIREALAGTYTDDPSLLTHADPAGPPTSIQQAAYREGGAPGYHDPTEGRPAPTPTTQETPR